MNYFVVSTAVLTGWAALGPLLGVRYGQELSRRFQRAQWVSDNKKQEYKDLISVMQAGAEGWVKYHGRGKSTDDYNVALELDRNVMLTIQLGIFIGEELNKNSVLERWKAFVQGMEGQSAEETGSNYGVLLSGIRDLARKNVFP
jgi:hypothetical protein